MAQEKWTLRRRKYQEIMNRFQISATLAKVISHRTTPEGAAYYLDSSGPLEDPFLMQDMAQAVALVEHHIASGSRILILGDYDVDGITASTILYLGIRRFADQIQIRIPDRIQDGYGIREYMMEEAALAEIGLIITCDNGIREFGAIAKAKEAGIDVLLTDHHEITTDEDGTELLPEADCILNPHRKTDAYPYKQICGAVVAFKLIQALYMKKQLTLPETLIGYAALGTVCDVMPLVGENRRIVYHGLKIWNQQPPVGIRAMMDAAGIHELFVHSFGFVIGPMLNSGGRLERQDRYIELLYTEDISLAEQLAGELYELNNTRKDMMIKGQEQAAEKIGTVPDDVLVIHLPQVHESIAGLIAGKIREQFMHPVFVLTGTGDHVKGSGRSIPAYNMFEAMQKQKERFIRFGGHPMAAGLSMKESEIEGLREALNRDCDLKPEDFCEEIIIDDALPLYQVTLDLAEELSVLEPYGNDNPKPLFAERGLDLRKLFLMGKNKNAARLILSDQGHLVEAVTFNVEPLKACIIEKYNQNTWDLLTRGEEFYRQISLDLCYQIGINEYRGVRNAQCIVCNLR